jgi:hypothetical protein
MNNEDKGCAFVIALVFLFFFAVALSFVLWTWLPIAIYFAALACLFGWVSYFG